MYSKRKDEPFLAFFKEYRRKAVETEFSVLTALLSSAIHGIAFQGFQIQLPAFIHALASKKPLI